ncbi:MAG: hypothetical protein Q9170_004700 [Blastenia crenularia]
MDALPPAIQQALEYEKSNWANGSVFEDPFYKLTIETANAPPGAPLKVEADTDTRKYLLPPATAMSRFIYMSQNFHGNAVPASAFVLWPYSPKLHKNRYPMVAWAHGTSGFFPNSAPSNHKHLWQHFLAPYQLAANGYVVVAPDYTGLGVYETSSGDPIRHEYLACPSHANDVVYAVQAAQSIFHELSDSFVAIGHSQGGGAAWAMAQRQVIKPVSGYLGAIAISPFTSLFGQEEPLRSVIVAAICPGLASINDKFQISDLLTEEGQQRLKTLKKSGAGIAAGVPILMSDNLLKPDWARNEHLQSFNQAISNGGKEISGPLLVIHGESDEGISEAVTSQAVEETSELFPSSQLEYFPLLGVSHVPALQASQRLWMEWIADRFAGREVTQGVQRSSLPMARPTTSYQKVQNWYLEAATEPYHAP